MKGWMERLRANPFRVATVKRGIEDDAPKPHKAPAPPEA